MRAKTAASARGLAVALALAILLGMFALIPPAAVAEGTAEEKASPMDKFTRVNTYARGQFADIDETLWYGYDRDKPIALAYEYGLMQGTGAAAFNPGGNVTVGQAVTIAVRVHSIYHSGSAQFTEVVPWYQVYVDYAVDKGIISSRDFSDYSRPATRAEMAYVFAHALPAGEFKDRDTGISPPDVPSSAPYSSFIHLLYTSGVLMGSDSAGTFNPNNPITRAEASAIISRVILPETRGGSSQEDDEDEDLSPESIKIKLLEDSAPLMPATGGVCYLGVVIEPEEANSDTGIEWSSSDTKVVTVDAEGVVRSVGDGVAEVTAKTENGKTATIGVMVMADISALSYNTDHQPAGAVTYDVKLGDTVGLLVPKITPENAYSDLEFKSSNPAVAQIITNEDGTQTIKALSHGQATITATSYNNITSSYTINVKLPLTNAALPASHAMEVKEYWTIPVTLTPATGSCADYLLASSDTSILRVEGNEKVFAVQPGTAKITVSIDGVVKSTCNVTVRAPKPNISGNPSFIYYDVSYESPGKATVTLGVVPVNNAYAYVVQEHINYSPSMSNAQLFDPSNLKNGDQYIILTEELAAEDWVLEFPDVDTGLRFFSIWAIDSAYNDISNVFLARVPVLYHPRNVFGSSQNSNDGGLIATSSAMVMPMLGNLNIDYSMGGDYGYWYNDPASFMFMLFLDPYAALVTFDAVPGAAGYDLYANCNGYDWGSAVVEQPAGGTGRAWFQTDWIFESGTLVFDILPYVIDIDGKKLHGEARTVILYVNTDAWQDAVVTMWETSDTYNSPVFDIHLGW